MIKANELRIGNLVKDRSGKALIVDWLERNKVCMAMNIDGNDVHPLTEDFEYCQPIPLTPEILEKVGFRMWLPNTQTFEHKEYNLWLSKCTNLPGYTFNARPDGGKPIEHLHQLQNLYFAITGTELEINL